MRCIILVISLSLSFSLLKAQILDQSQSLNDWGFWFDSAVVRYQEFKPAKDSLLKIEIFVGKWGNPGDIIISIKDSVDNLISSGIVAQDKIMDLTWCSYEFYPPIILDEKQAYKIYVRSSLISTDPQNRYFWAGSLSSFYTRGITDVEIYWPGYDYAFRTYSVGKTLAVIDTYSNILTTFSLAQNYPNPFNPSTAIRFGIPNRSNVKVQIFNTLGQNVATLFNEQKDAGYYEATWNAVNQSSGVYFYRIDATALDNPSNRFIETKKMILMK